MDIVPKAKVHELTAQLPPVVFPKCAGISFGPRGELPRNVATTFGVKIAECKYLVTAGHVVSSEAAKAFPWQILVPPRDLLGRVPFNAALNPNEIPLDPTVAWFSRSLDVAFLNWPPGLALETFDSARAAEVTSKIRTDWDAGKEHDAFRMVGVSGMPNFARDRQREKPILGLGSLPAFITSARRPDQEVLIGGKPSQLVLDFGELRIAPEHANHPLACLYESQLAVEDPDPLGGLSGGPVVVKLAKETQLVGVFTEGRRCYGRGLATPWDNVHNAYFKDRTINLVPKR
jgi:hypothetical protein